MQNITSNPEEQEFLVNGLKISAKVWNKDAKIKAIALHGWLDNANSFDPLVPLLNDMTIVALDSPGQGKSDFRSLDAAYLIWLEVGETMQVADQLGWEDFVLIGHSRGAGIASLIAGTFPDRVSHLVLLEGGIPLPMTPQETPENLAKSIEITQQLAEAKGTLFKTREEAISARADGFTKIAPQSAEIFAQRSLYQESDGFRWHADPRLKAPSAFKLGDSQIDAFLSRVTAKTLLVIGDEGIVGTMNFSKAHFEKIPTLKKLTLPGGHHMHMEGAEKAIAEEIKSLI